MIWINCEDHMRIIYLEDCADFSSIYNKWIFALNILSKHLHFAEDPLLGYLNSCPSNIGTAMRISIYLSLNYIQQPEVEDVCK